jgi:hypothetical protein
MMTTTSWSIEVGHHESDASAQAVRSKAGSLAIFAAMRRAGRRGDDVLYMMMFYTLRKHS